MCLHLLGLSMPPNLLHIRLYICLSTSLPACMPACLSTSLPACMSACLSVYLPVYLPAYVPIILPLVVCIFMHIAIFIFLPMISLRGLYYPFHLYHIYLPLLPLLIISMPSTLFIRYPGHTASLLWWSWLLRTAHVLKLCSSSSASTNTQRLLTCINGNTSLPSFLPSCLSSFFSFFFPFFLPFFHALSCHFMSLHGTLPLTLSRHISSL